jgi:hypothetical protein
MRSEGSLHMKFIPARNGFVILTAWRLRGALLRSACSASLLLVVMALTAGCPIIVPWPGDVRANGTRIAAAGLRPDEGVVVIADGEIRASDRDQEVISCVRHALATSQPVPRVFAPDAPVRPALLDLQEGKGLEADAALQKYVTSLRLRYAVFVTLERGQKSVKDHSSNEYTEWHVLNGLVMDLSSGLPIGSVRAGTEATSTLMAFMPWFFVWVPQWTRDGKACMEFGREVAELLRDDKSAGLQNDSQRTRMPSPGPEAVPPPDDQSPETSP